MDSPCLLNKPCFIPILFTTPSGKLFWYPWYLINQNLQRSIAVLKTPVLEIFEWYIHIQLWDFLWWGTIGYRILMRTTRQNVSAFPTGSKRKPLYLNSEALYCANNLSRASCPDLALIDNEILPLTRKTTEGPLFVLLNNGLIEPIPRRWRAGRNLLWHPSDSPLRSQKRLKLNNKVQTPGGILVVSNGGKWKFTYTLQLKLIFRTFFLLISIWAMYLSRKNFHL